MLNSNKRWNETIKIKNYIIKNYVYKKFFSKDEKVMNVSLPNYKDNINLVCNKDIIIPTKVNSIYDSKIIKPCKDIDGTLYKSSPLGSIEIYEDNNLILKESLRIENISKNQIKPKKWNIF
jgi:serine-type D-Ala-D-Ala carboxypeptidase (penicillin-binding protein 5/6)